MDYSKATFPNGIILNSNYPLHYENGKLEIENSQDSFFIIDGQHRIEALKYYKGKAQFEMCVIIFEHIDKDTQTDIFATVNSEQKPVNASVKLNLKGNDSVDTPEKVVRRIAIALNEEKESPFKNRIKFSDEPVKRGELKLSLAAFARPIVSYIYNMEKSFDVKDCLYMNKNDRLALAKNGIDFNQKLLWKYYINGDESLIYALRINYFTAIMDILPSDWNDKDSLLSKTSGYNALMYLFKDLLIDSPYDMSYDYLYSKLRPLKQMKGSFTLDRVGVGNSAAVRLYKEFCKNLNTTNSDIDLETIYVE